MYDHIGLKVKDLAASSRFYGALLAPLGFVKGPEGEDYVGFGPQNAPGFWLLPNKEKRDNPGTHVAFAAPDRAAVERFHAEGIKAGAKDNGKPGLRTGYSPKYYAAFLIDPDGNNVEAVCFK